MAPVTSASPVVTFASRYSSRSSMYIRGLSPLDFTELAEAVPIGVEVSSCLILYLIPGKSESL